MSFRDFADLLLDPTHSRIYLLYLKGQALAICSAGVHLAAVSAFQPKVDNQSEFDNDISIRFLKGLDKLYPQVHNPVPQWTST